MTKEETGGPELALQQHLKELGSLYPERCQKYHPFQPEALVPKAMASSGATVILVEEEILGLLVQAGLQKVWMPEGSNTTLS